MAATLALALAAGFVGAVDYPPVTPTYRIELPRDEGSHPGFRTEWWYITGWLEDENDVPRGFQITFFRTRPGIHEQNPSRFAPRQLLFAHAAVSDVERGRLAKAQRSARAGFGLAYAAEGSLEVAIDDWHLRRRADGRMVARVAGEDFSLALEFEESQPLLLHGQQGFSRKGPLPHLASHYYSLPQLRAAGRLVLGERAYRVRGRAWMDHEWASEILHEKAVGWDWVGLNLHDGGALMALQVRDAQGAALWAGGTLRPGPHAAVRVYEPREVQWTALRRWRSPRTGVEFAVEWRVRVGDHTLTLRPMMDDQENDARDSTGTLYWEGAVRAFDEAGREVGRGYLELTGYAGRILL